MTEEEKILMAEEEAWLAEEAEERGDGGAESSGSSDEELDDLQGPLSKQLQVRGRPWDADQGLGVLQLLGSLMRALHGKREWVPR